jgi:hypothetical protein
MSDGSKQKVCCIPEMVDPTVAWKACKAAMDARGRNYGVIALITTKEKCIGEKAIIIPKIVEIAYPGLSVIISSGDTLDTAVSYMGATLKEVSLIIVSPHSPVDRKKLALQVKETWGVDASAVLEDRSAYVVIGLRHTCGRALGEICDKCPKIVKSVTV